MIIVSLISNEHKILFDFFPRNKKTFASCLQVLHAFHKFRNAVMKFVRVEVP